jgi:hypothetical protein
MRRELGKNERLMAQQPLRDSIALFSVYDWQRTLVTESTECSLLHPKFDWPFQSWCW